MQELITKSVIDTPLRNPHPFDVITHDEIREELIRQIDEGRIKQANVARKLAIAPARVAEMRKRERRVQQDEMHVLAQLLGLAEDPIGSLPKVKETTEIPLLGKVAQGVWLEQDLFDPEGRDYVTYDKMSGDAPAIDLFAVVPDGTSMNKTFPQNTRLICRKLPFGSGQVVSGDYVIAQRAAHDLYEFTCKRLEIDKDGVYWLHSESTDERYKEPWHVGKPDEGLFTDNEIRIVAKVIRAVQDFENGAR